MQSFFFIFSRFKKLDSRKGFLSFTYYLSICLISFSLFTSIISESLTDGYKKEIKSKISAFNFDFKIYKNNFQSFSFDNLNQFLYFFENENENFNSHLTPYKEINGIIFIENNFDSIKYHQREGFQAHAFKKDYIIKKHKINDYLEDRISSFNDSSIIIGEALSTKINKKINDKVKLLFYHEESNTFVGRNFTISNIFSTNTQYDDFLILLSIEGIDFEDGKYCDSVVGNYGSIKESMKIDFKKFNIEYWNSDYLSKFLDTFDIPIKLILIILMMLSLYSLSSLIFNFLEEKKYNLKLLYYFGYSISNIRFLVLFLSLHITFISIIIGSILSAIFIFLQNKYQVIKLPSKQIFQIDYIPASFELFYFVKYPFFLIVFTIIMSLLFFNRYSRNQFK